MEDRRLIPEGYFPRYAGVYFGPLVRSPDNLNRPATGLGRLGLA